MSGLPKSETELQDIKLQDIQEQDIVWEPIKGSSQEIAIDARADHILYYGTRGPGKTATQLMYFRQFVGIGYGSFWKGVLFDKHYKSFTDIISQSKRFFLPFGDCRFMSGTSEVKWVWDSGEEFLMRHVKDENAYEDGFHGTEFPFVGFNELTKQPNNKLYNKMTSINRSSFSPIKHTPRNSKGKFLTDDEKPLPEIPLKIFSTCNPSGVGRSWVKKRFIDCARPGQIVKNTMSVFNPKTQQEEDITITQVAIFGSYKENIYLSPKYIAQLHEMTKSNPHLKAAWIEGKWDVSTGGAIDDLFDGAVHTLERFKIPSNWYTKRCFDWGSTSPFAVVWLAISNGEEVLVGNKNRTFPKGSVIVFNEWYGGEDVSENIGLKMSAKEIAIGIKDMERDMFDMSWITNLPNPGAADNQIGNEREVDVDTIKKKMEDEGIKWTASDKSKGSRVNGLQLIRDRLSNAKNGEGQGLYFMNNCLACLETIPYLPRDEKNENDIDSESNDHLYDALRYGILEIHKVYAKKIDVEYMY